MCMRVRETQNTPSPKVHFKKRDSPSQIYAEIGWKVIGRERDAVLLTKQKVGSEDKANKDTKQGLFYSFFYMGNGIMDF